jgi:hypothetical protein
VTAVTLRKETDGGGPGGVIEKTIRNRETPANGERPIAHLYTVISMS